MPNEPKADYIARYGQVAWSEACALATRHRGRTRERGLMEHFTAMQWLNLCEEFGFACPWCLKPAKLSPHHRHELHDGGPNTIDNLLPLCWSCHQRFHGGLMSCDSDWLPKQFALCEERRVGDRVQYHYPDTGGTMSTIMEIIEIVPPAPVSRAKTANRRAWHCWGVQQLGGLIIDGTRVTHWRQAMARVRGPHGREHPPRWGYSLDCLVPIAPGAPAPLGDSSLEV
jgi:hypothetical protein